MPRQYAALLKWSQWGSMLCRGQSKTVAQPECSTYASGGIPRLAWQTSIKVPICQTLILICDHISPIDSVQSGNHGSSRHVTGVLLGPEDPRLFIQKRQLSAQVNFSPVCMSMFVSALQPSLLLSVQCLGRQLSQAKSCFPKVVFFNLSALSPVILPLKQSILPNHCPVGLVFPHLEFCFL